MPIYSVSFNISDTSIKMLQSIFLTKESEASNLVNNEDFIEYMVNYGFIKKSEDKYYLTLPGKAIITYLNNGGLENGSELRFFEPIEKGKE